MTDRRLTKRRTLAYEILGLIAVSALFSALLSLILFWTAGAVVEAYCYNRDMVITELDWLGVDRWIFMLSAILTALGFSLLFLVLLGDRMAYIRTLTEGIEALRTGQADHPLPLEGKNELTQLAEAINDLSATQKRLREKEQTLAHEREQFIRTLSHDIRTPLTAILSWTEYLTGDSPIPPEEQKLHLQTIRKKAEQIRDLGALLLDGGKQNPQIFDNGRLLMEQLAAEFEEELEERFAVQTDLTGCTPFSGTFDLQDLRRIFDNLSINIQKYADPATPVLLYIFMEGGSLHIRQCNGISTAAQQHSSYKLGIHSMRRIAQNYGGNLTLRQDGNSFSISITLSDF